MRIQEKKNQKWILKKNPASHDTPSLILAVEEPELYLHPLRCKYLSSLFTQLTSIDEDENSPRNQILFSSHSPHFVDLNHFSMIRIFRKVKTEDNPVAITKTSSFSVSSAIDQLSEVSQIPREEITYESFTSRILPVMTSIANEGFFADLVVLVEGFGDVGILIKLQDILGKNWLSKGIAVIPITGKNKLDRPTLIFQGLDIPTYVLFDGDKQNKGKDNEKSTIKTNQLLTKLLSGNGEDFPETQVQPTWAVFEENIETEFKSVLGQEEYNKYRQQIADEFSIPKLSQITKNLHCSSCFIEAIYDDGTFYSCFGRNSGIYYTTQGLDSILVKVEISPFIAIKKE